MKAVAVILFALVASAYAAVVKDVTGGTYDLHTGQYSSAVTGHVYNSAPAVAHVGYAAPHVGYAAPLGYASHLGYAGHLGYAQPLAYGGLYV